MKVRNWFWGLFFIVAAGLIIANQLGYLTGINLFSLVCIILLIPIIVKSAMHLNFSGILFPIAFLGIIFAEPLGITNLTPWPILAAALFGSIGLQIIFRPRYHCKWENRNENFDEIIDTPDGTDVSCRVNFGATTKYVNAENYKKGFFSASFGAMKVYFDNAHVEESAQIYLDVSFAGVELYVPKNWRIINDTSCSLGGIEEKNGRVMTEKGPTVTIKGRVSFAGVEIIYV